jgi:tetratricopeptide (TPR) repeat protein
MRSVDHPRSGFAAPPQGGPAKPDSRRSLGWAAAFVAFALAGCASNPISAIKDAVSVPAPAKPAATAPAAPTPAPTMGTSALNIIEAPMPEATQREFQRGLQAQRAGRADEAQRIWEAMAKTNPGLGGVHANLGLLHRAAGRHADSVASLERAVAASPKQARFWNELGVSYRHVGQFGKAQAAYERALAEDASLAAASLNLGILYDLYLNDAAKALPLFERYVALAPGDANATKWVADVKRRAAGPSAPTAPTAPTAAKKESS